MNAAVAVPAATVVVTSCYFYIAYSAYKPAMDMYTSYMIAERMKNKCSQSYMFYETGDYVASQKLPAAIANLEQLNATCSLTTSMFALAILVGVMYQHYGEVRSLKDGGIRQKGIMSVVCLTVLACLALIIYTFTTSSVTGFNVGLVIACIGICIVTWGWVSHQLLDDKLYGVVIPLIILESIIAVSLFISFKPDADTVTSRYAKNNSITRMRSGCALAGALGILFVVYFAVRSITGQGLKNRNLWSILVIGIILITILSNLLTKNTQDLSNARDVYMNYTGSLADKMADQAITTDVQHALVTFMKQYEPAAASSATVSDTWKYIMNANGYELVDVYPHDCLTEIKVSDATADATGFTVYRKINICNVTQNLGKTGPTAGTAAFQCLSTYDDTTGLTHSHIQAVMGTYTTATPEVFGWMDARNNRDVRIIEGTKVYIFRLTDPDVSMQGYIIAMYDKDTNAPALNFHNEINRIVSATSLELGTFVPNAPAAMPANIIYVPWITDLSFSKSPSLSNVFTITWNAIFVGPPDNTWIVIKAMSGATQKWVLVAPIKGIVYDTGPANPTGPSQHLTIYLSDLSYSGTLHACCATTATTATSHEPLDTAVRIEAGFGNVLPTSLTAANACDSGDNSSKLLAGYQYIKDQGTLYVPYDTPENLVLNQHGTGGLNTEWTGTLCEYKKPQGPVYIIDSSVSSQHPPQTTVVPPSQPLYPKIVYGEYIDYKCISGGQTAGSYAIRCSYGSSLPQSWVLVGSAINGTWSVIDQFNYNVLNMVCPYTHPENNPWAGAQGTIHRNITTAPTPPPPSGYLAYRLIITSVSQPGHAHVSGFELYMTT
jgi:hypothetical protein